MKFPWSKPALKTEPPQDPAPPVNVTLADVVNVVNDLVKQVNRIERKVYRDNGKDEQGLPVTAVNTPPNQDLNPIDINRVQPGDYIDPQYHKYFK